MELILIFLVFGGGYLVGGIFLARATFCQKKIVPLLLSLFFILPQHGCYGLYANSTGSVFDGSDFQPYFKLITWGLALWYGFIILVMLVSKLASDSASEQKSSLIKCPECGERIDLDDFQDSWESPPACPKCNSNITSNQRVDLTVKTPVESGNEQRTAGHP